MKRRKFLRNSIALSAAPLVLNQIPVKAMASANWNFLNCLDTHERVMVIVNMKGGNDGLNTLIPMDQYSTYAGYRSTTRILDSGANGYIPLDNTLAIADQVGLHPNLTGFKSLYDAGKLNIIQGVTYPDTNKSHFRSVDIWMTGSDGGTVIDTGWMGRFLDHIYPGSAGNPNSQMPDPLGIQLGDAKPSLGFHTENEHSTEINLTGQDPSGFYSLIQGIGGAPIANIPTPSQYGKELEFIMNIEQSVNVYAQRITDVFNMGINSSVVYPDHNLADQLKTVARLIQGGSKTKIFMVNIGGFDTHAGQVDPNDPTNPAAGSHGQLMLRLAESMKAFQDDIEALSIDHKIMTVGFSEFGRKVQENASFGTDHGTLAPMFVMGSAVEPGVLGTNVDLSNLASNFQLQGMQHDYRQVFTTLLQDWIGAGDTALAAAQFAPFASQKLNLISSGNIVDPGCYFDNVLPVELAEFSAEVIRSNQVLLEWETHAEVNSGHFEIQRSANAINFETIDKIQAAGTSTSLRYYNYTDTYPLRGLSYYRLKEVDLDQKVQFSDIRSVKILQDNLGIEDRKIYPNPAVYQFFVSITSDVFYDLQLTINDLSGRKVFEQMLAVREGFNKFAIPVNDLGAGQYVVSVNTTYKGDEVQSSSSIIIG